MSHNVTVTTDLKPAGNFRVSCFEKFGEPGDKANICVDVATIQRFPVSVL